MVDVQVNQSPEFPYLTPPNTTTKCFSQEWNDLNHSSLVKFGHMTTLSGYVSGKGEGAHF
jgi:hypothetical protein